MPRRLFFLIVSVAATSQLACSHDSVDIRTLEPGKRIERQIPRGEVHAYDIKLQAGQVLRVEVQTTNVKMDVLQPDGSKAPGAWAYNYDEEVFFEVTN